MAEGWPGSLAQFIEWRLQFRLICFFGRFSNVTQLAPRLVAHIGLSFTYFEL